MRVSGERATPPTVVTPSMLSFLLTVCFSSSSPTSTSKADPPGMFTTSVGKGMGGDKCNAYNSIPLQVCYRECFFFILYLPFVQASTLRGTL